MPYNSTRVLHVKCSEDVYLNYESLFMTRIKKKSILKHFFAEDSLLGSALYTELSVDYCFALSITLVTFDSTK